MKFNFLCDKVQATDCKADHSNIDRPYFHSDGTEYNFRKNLYYWQSDMLTCMKNCMGHNKHILSVNYLTDGPKLPDSTYYLPYLDLITHQQYSDFPDIYDHSVTTAKSIHNSFDKPFLHGEFGSGTAYSACDSDASWIRDLWIGSFTGICGSALLWDYQHKPYLWPHFGRLRFFVAGYNFDESSDDQQGWVPYHDYDKLHYENWQRKPGIVDLFYLRSPDKCV